MSIPQRSAPAPIHITLQPSNIGPTCIYIHERGLKSPFCETQLSNPHDDLALDTQQLAQMISLATLLSSKLALDMNFSWQMKTVSCLSSWLCPQPILMFVHLCSRLKEVSQNRVIPLTHDNGHCSRIHHGF